MIQTIDKQRRSVKLTKEEKTELKKFVKAYITREDAALVVGLHRDTLNRILELGRCNSDTLIKIKKTLNLN